MKRLLRVDNKTVRVKWTKEASGCWIYKAEDDWSWIAKVRPHGDDSDVDDESSLDIEEECRGVEDGVCYGESDDN